MVNVSEKTITKRLASAEGRIIVPETAYNLVCGMSKSPDAELDEEIQARKRKASSKGDVCSVAQLAGIMCDFSSPCFIFY